MDVADGLVACDWRVDITSCENLHERRIITAVLVLCVCFYVVLAVIGYGILWARQRYHLSPVGPIINFRHPDGGIRPKPIESFCALSIAGLLVRSITIFLVIIDAFPRSTIVQELISEIAVCCSFPCWACFVIGIWYATPKLSVPGDTLKIRVPRPKIINVVFFYLLFGPFLLDLPSVISSGTFLSRRQYTKTNIAIAIHFTTLGAVLMVATAIFFFTLNQLAKAIEEYTVPSDMTLVHVVGTPPGTPESPDNPMFTLSPLPENERTDQDWDNNLAKVRSRLISIRNAGSVMLCFYVVMYLVYGICRPMIHNHIVWNVFFCICFNLDPGTPTIFAYFIFSVMYHVRQGPPRPHQVYSSGLAPVSRPAMSHFPSSGPMRRLSDFRITGADPHPSTSAYASRHDLSVLQSLEMALLDGPSISPSQTFLGRVEHGSMFSKHSHPPSAEISIPSPSYSASSTLRSNSLS